jgi:hypothetical protein
MDDFETLPAGSWRAMNLALEALEFMADQWGFTNRANRPERWQAIEALRAALAKPEEQHQPGCALLKIPSRDCDCSPEQEPVAHLWQHSETGRTRVVMPDQVVTADGDWRVVGPLHLHPPRREPADHIPDAEKMVEMITIEELEDALGLPHRWFGVTGKRRILRRVEALRLAGRQLLAEQERREALMDDLKSALAGSE